MKIKDKNPRYVYTNGQEIDFMVNNTLIEVKYHRDIEGKQLAAFEQFESKKKLVIKNHVDLQKML